MGLGVLEERECVWAYGVALYCACPCITCVPLFFSAEMRAGHEMRGNAPTAALRTVPDDDVRGVSGSGTSSKTAVEKFGS